MAYSVSNDSVLLGNDLKASDGTTAITLTDSTGAVATAGAVSAGGDVTLASGKDLVLQGGGYIKAGASGTLFKNSSDTTILSSSGGDISVSANLGVTGDLTVTGNDIKDSSAATALSFSSGAVTTGGNFTVGSSGTTTFNGIAYTWPAADASSSGYVLKSNSLGTLSWGADDAGGITTSRQTGTSFSAAAGYFYLCDISASCEVTLPTPSAGDRIIFKAGGSVSGSVKVSLKSAAAADKIDGAAHNSSPLDALVTAYAAVELVACAGDGLGTIEWFIV